MQKNRSGYEAKTEDGGVGQVDAAVVIVTVVQLKAIGYKIQLNK